MRFVVLATALALAAGVASARDYEVGTLRITGAIAAPTAPGQPNGAAYLTIENTGPENDNLIGLESPAAAAAEIHTTSEENGVARMQQLKSIEISAGMTLIFSPGRLHVMLIGLKEPLKTGETAPLTLTFEKAGKVTIDLTVETPPEPAHEGHDGHEGHGGGHAH